MLDSLIARLQQANLDLSDKQIADAIWLAMQMGVPKTVAKSVNDAPALGQEKRSDSVKSFELGVSGGDRAGRGDNGTKEQPASISAYAKDTISGSSPQGLPFKAPAAAALRNVMELGRSLRPLMRKVPSQTNFVLDEEETVNCIVEQDLWQPVLCPAPERWLDLELVIEASPLSFIWQKSIEEFQHKVLERQGAFRHIRAWTLQDINPKTPQGKPVLVTRSTGETIARSSKPEELVHISGRRLVLLVSDCRSNLWRQAPTIQQVGDQLGFRSCNPVPDNLYNWLFYWGSKGSLVLLQLLPEWLWERSAVGLGFDVQFSTLLPGMPNSQLVVQGLSQRQRKRANVDLALRLPIITLDTDPILQWAAIIAGSGNIKIPGILFNPELLRSLLGENQSSENTASAESRGLSESEAERLVDTFLAVASPTAQQLAGMMAAAPVSLPVVHLIQAQLLKSSTLVHVAEVYMSGMLEQRDINEMGQPIYDFKPHVRKLLNQAMPLYSTEEVLNTLSEAIAKKHGKSINDFRAFLSSKAEWKDTNDRIVTPFAKILPEVLQNMGGEYAALVDTSETSRSEADTQAPEIEVDAKDTAIAQAQSGDLAAALTTARQIENSYSKADALVAIAKAQAAARDSQAAQATLNEALAATRAIQDEYSRADALRALADKLPPELLPEVLASARASFAEALTTPSQKILVLLVLPANPKNSTLLRLDEELREIDEGLQRAKYRDQFALKQKWAVRLKDVQRAILDLNPQIVHFSGHGLGNESGEQSEGGRKLSYVPEISLEPEGLVFEDDAGQVKLVNTKAIADLFKLLAGQIECVVLNACYSAKQAEAIAQHIPYVIGMSRAVGDTAARVFAVGFYDALGAGSNIEQAFELACNQIDLENIPESSTPQLMARQNRAIPTTTDETKSEIPVIDQSIASSPVLERPEGSVSLKSLFYIERPPIEGDCYDEIVQPGALIRIKAPRQMGKSSLLQRILAHAKNSEQQTASLNFQSADAEFLNHIDLFLQWFCASVSSELGLDDRLEELWKGVLGSKNKCTNYFQRYLLATTTKPLVLGLDEVDQVFQHPMIAQEFFGLLRAWHEKSKNDSVWQKLRIVIVHSKEAYIPMNINQSPFNVGLSIELPELTATQVTDLVERHGLKWTDAEVREIMDVVDGHPYLLRQGLYEIARGNLKLADFAKVAPTEAGLYGDHLRRHLMNLRANPKLATAMRQVISSSQPTRLEPIQAFQLRSIGLVKLRGNDVQPLCNLYRIYFRDQLGV